MSVLGKISKGIELVRRVGFIPFTSIIFYRLGFESSSTHLFSRYFGFNHSDFNLKIMWVDVEELKYNYLSYLDFEGKNWIHGRADGGWDMLREPIEAKYLKSFRMVFDHEYEWKETPLYEESVKRINEGKKAMHCEEVEELHERLNYLEQLRESLKEKGYVPRFNQDWEENEDISVSLGDIRIPDDPRVAIGRNGELMHINGGSHRLALAKLLEIDTIPVIVQIEHEEFDGELDVSEVIELDT